MLFSKMADKEERQSKRNAQKCAQITNILVRQEVRAHNKKISEILKKPAEEHTAADMELLKNSPDVVKKVQKGVRTRRLMKERKEEVEDSEESLQQKCIQLATAIRQAKNVVLYTGAGISTAAEIPDYRGPNGVWTCMNQGKTPPTCKDIVDCSPTRTHMIINEMYRSGLIKYVVSQNCDGLHIRSGLPRQALSELHGNMFIEVCSSCQHEYMRLFDVTERTGLRKHRTGRTCGECKNELKDTIIHFGEKAPVHSPHNWSEAIDAADSADVIVCLGTSLKVLKSYRHLWAMDKPKDERPKLFIVNLQWTPKDDSAVLKINGKCDVVMGKVAMELGIKAAPYIREIDPIFFMASDPLAGEESVATTKVMPQPKYYDKGRMQNLHSVTPLPAEKTIPHRKHRKLELDEIPVMMLEPARSPLSGESTMSSTSGATLSPQLMEDEEQSPLSKKSRVSSPVRYEHAMESDKLKSKCFVKLSVLPDEKLAEFSIGMPPRKEEKSQLSPFEQADDFAEMRLAYIDSDGSMDTSPVKSDPGSNHKLRKPSKSPQKVKEEMENVVNKDQSNNNELEMPTAMDNSKPQPVPAIKNSPKHSASSESDTSKSTQQDSAPAQSDSAKLESGPSASAQPDLAQPESAGCSESAQPVLAQVNSVPDTGQTNSEPPDSVQPDLPQPESAQPDTAQTNSVQPESAQPDTVLSDSAASKPVSSESATPQALCPTPAEPQPECENVVTEYVVTENDATDHMDSEPAVSEVCEHATIETTQDTVPMATPTKDNAQNGEDDQCIPIHLPHSSPVPSDDVLSTPSTEPFHLRPCDIFGHSSACTCKDKQTVESTSCNYKFRSEKPRSQDNGMIGYKVSELSMNLSQVAQEIEKDLRETQENGVTEHVDHEETVEDEKDHLDPLPQNMFPGVEILEQKHEERTPFELVSATDEELQNLLCDVDDPMEKQDPNAVMNDPNITGIIMDPTPSLPTDPETDAACVILMEQEAAMEDVPLDDEMAMAAAMEVVVDEGMELSQQYNSEFSFDNLIIPEGSTCMQTAEGFTVIHPDGKQVVYVIQEGDADGQANVQAIDMDAAAADPNFLSPATVDHMLTDSIQEVVSTDLPELPVTGDQIKQQFHAELENLILNVQQDNPMNSKVSSLESIIPEDQLEASVNEFRQAAASLSCNGEAYKPKQTTQNGKKKAPARKRKYNKASNAGPPAKVHNPGTSSADALAVAMNQSGIYPGMSPRYAPSPHVPTPPQNANASGVMTGPTGAMPHPAVPNNAGPQQQQVSQQGPGGEQAGNNTTIGPSYALEQLIALMNRDRTQLIPEAVAATDPQIIQQCALCLLRLPESHKTEEVKRVVEVMHVNGFIPPGPGRPNPPALSRPPQRPPIRLPNGELLPEAHMAAAVRSPPPSFPSPSALGIPSPMMSPGQHGPKPVPKTSPPQNSGIHKNYPSIMCALKAPTMLSPAQASQIPFSQQAASNLQQAPGHQQQAPSYQQQAANHPQQAASHPQQAPNHPQQVPNHPQQTASHPQQVASHPQQAASHHPPPSYPPSSYPPASHYPGAPADHHGFLPAQPPPQLPPPTVSMKIGEPASCNGNQMHMNLLDTVLKKATPISSSQSVNYTPPAPVPYVPPPSQLVTPPKKASPPKRKKQQKIVDEVSQQQRIQSILDEHKKIVSGGGGDGLLASPPVGLPAPSVAATQPPRPPPPPRSRKKSQPPYAPPVTAPMPYLPHPPHPVSQHRAPLPPAHATHVTSSHGGLPPLPPPPRYAPPPHHQPQPQASVPYSAEQKYAPPPPPQLTPHSHMPPQQLPQQQIPPQQQPQQQQQQQQPPRQMHPPQQQHSPRNTNTLPPPQQQQFTPAQQQHSPQQQPPQSPRQAGPVGLQLPPQQLPPQQMPQQQKPPQQQMPPLQQMLPQQKPPQQLPQQQIPPQQMPPQQMPSQQMPPQQMPAHSQQQNPPQQQMPQQQMPPHSQQHSPRLVSPQQQSAPQHSPQLPSPSSQQVTPQLPPRLQPPAHPAKPAEHAALPMPSSAPGNSIPAPPPGLSIPAHIGYPYVPPPPTTPSEAKQQAEYYSYLATANAATGSVMADMYQKLAVQAAHLATQLSSPEPAPKAPPAKRSRGRRKSTNTTTTSRATYLGVQGVLAAVGISTTATSHGSTTSDSKSSVGSSSLSPAHPAPTRADATSLSPAPAPLPPAHVPSISRADSLPYYHRPPPQPSMLMRQLSAPLPAHTTSMASQPPHLLPLSEQEQPLDLHAKALPRTTAMQTVTATTPAKTQATLPPSTPPHHTSIPSTPSAIPSPSPSIHSTMPSTPSMQSSSSSTISSSPRHSSSVTMPSTPTTSTNPPSHPSNLPATPSANPSTPSAIPSTPSAIPSNPSAPSAIPATPSAIPSNLSTPSAIPSIPSSIPSNPSTPSAIPSTPNAIPSTPTPMPSNPSTIPSNTSTGLPSPIPSANSIQPSTLPATTASNLPSMPHTASNSVGPCPIGPIPTAEENLSLGQRKQLYRHNSFHASPLPTTPVASPATNSPAASNTTTSPTSCPSASPATPTTPPSPVTAPGWFGKGLKKPARAKRAK